MVPLIVGLLTFLALAVSVLVALRRPTPPVPLAVLAAGAPIFTYVMYLEPFPGPVFAVLLIAGLLGGAALQQASPSWNITWRRSDALSLYLRVAWTAAFLWAQEAELAGSFAWFRVGVALFAVAGGVWCGYLVVWRARQQG